MPRKKKKTPLTPEERAQQEFIGVTRKRSAQMAAIAVIIMLICRQQGVDLWLAIGLVLIAFALFNGLHIYFRRRRQANAAAPPPDGAKP